MSAVTDRIERGLEGSVFAIDRVMVGRDVNGDPIPIVPRTEPDAAREVFNRIYALAQDGEPIPADVAQPILDARAADALAMARAIAINQVGDALDELKRDSDASRIPDLFPMMTAELERIFAEVKKLKPKLRGATTPAEVLESGSEAADAWRELRRLTGEYSEVRGLQQKYTLQVLGHDAGDKQQAIQWMLSVGMFRNAVDIAPMWLQNRSIAWGGVPDPATHFHAAAYTDWFKSGRTAMGRWSDKEVEGWATSWWPTSAFGGHEGFLLWLTKHAKPFAALPDDLEELHTSAVTITSSWRDPGSLTERIRSMARYAELTGWQLPFAMPEVVPDPKKPRGGPMSDSAMIDRQIRGRIGSTQGTTAYTRMAAGE